MNRNQIIQGIKSGELTEAVLRDETILFPKFAFVIHVKKPDRLYQSGMASRTKVRPSTIERIIADIKAGQYDFLTCAYDDQIRSEVITLKTNGVSP